MDIDSKKQYLRPKMISSVLPEQVWHFQVEAPRLDAKESFQRDLVFLVGLCPAVFLVTNSVSTLRAAASCSRVSLETFSRRWRK